MDNVIAEYDRRISELVDERDELYVAVVAIRLILTDYEHMSISSMSNALQNIAKVVTEAP